jgi:MazG family protein
MAEEEGAFGFDDVVEAISAKMIRRHPHVFGDAAARGRPPAKGFWEAAKARSAPVGSAGAGRQGLLDDVPIALPALPGPSSSRAARRGPASTGRWPAMWSTRSPRKPANWRKRRAVRRRRTRRREELGDLMFAVANLARHLEVDPETALRAANAKFERRFRFIERELARRGKRPETSTLEEMDAIWNDAKAAERRVLRLRG